MALLLNIFGLVLFHTEEWWIINSSALLYTKYLILFLVSIMKSQALENFSVQQRSPFVKKGLNIRYSCSWSQAQALSKHHVPNVAPLSSRKGFEVFKDRLKSMYPEVGKAKFQAFNNNSNLIFLVCWTIVCTLCSGFLVSFWLFVVGFLYVQVWVPSTQTLLRCY